jgi:hypothetical protein
VDQLLDGAAPEESAGLALGGQDVGTVSDAERGGRISSRVLGVVRFAAARRPRNDARASPATGAAGTGSGAGWAAWALGSAVLLVPCQPMIVVPSED